ncbi:putative transmembrane protein, partial [Rhizoctonia solani 123E]
MPGPLQANPEYLAQITAEITSIREWLDVTKYLGVAAATILIYDILSTLDEEINCIGISLFYVLGSIVVMWIVTAMLMVRIWVIYGKSRWFLFGILTSFLVITVPTIIIHVVSLMSSHWVHNP